MQIIFEPILHIELWHDYFIEPSYQGSILPQNYSISGHLDLVPTQECQKQLRNLRWLFRPQPYGAILLAHLNFNQDNQPQGSNSNAGKLTPIIPIDSNVKLTFWLVVKADKFANYTNLPLDAHRNKFYYFSNQSNNFTDQHLYLSQALNAYTPGTEYALGQLVTYAPENATLESAQHLDEAGPTPNLIPPAVFEQALTPEADPAQPNSFSGEWLPLPNSQYVSAKDLLPRQALSRKETIPDASPGETFRFSLVNLNGQTTFVQTLEVPKEHRVGTPFPVSLNFTGQDPGHYQLFLNEDQLDEFILFDPMVGRDAFALVEISLQPSLDSSSSQLLDSTGELHPQTYRLRFKNRATRWRYHCDRPFDVDHLPAYFQPIDETTYATKYPIGLYRQPERLPLDSTDHPLPAPSPAMITPVVKNADDGRRKITAIFSDIYL